MSAYIYTTDCIVCNKTFSATNARRTCSKECEQVRRRSKALPPVVMKCNTCGVEVQCSGRAGRHMVRRGTAYCSKECGRVQIAKTSAVTIAKTNRKYASARMRANNPMKRPEIREKMSATMRIRNHRPIIQGGNGRGATRQERALATALGWMIGFVLPTKVPKGNGIPTHYKIDVANPELKVAIEVDGNSHSVLVRREQDAKKTAFLQSKGWKVLRFTNQQVDEHLAVCTAEVASAITKV